MFSTLRSFQRVGRVVFQRAYKPSFVNYNKFFFAGTVEKAAQKLSKSIDKEIKYEKDNYVELEDKAVFLKESGFTLNETDKGTIMTLTKLVDGKMVEIIFQSRPPTPNEEPEQENEEEKKTDAQKQEEDDMDLGDNFCDFTVCIYNKNTPDVGMLVECTTMDTEISINNLVVVNENLSQLKNQHRYERSWSMYNGPDFSTLDERIQTALIDYLSSLGVNDHLAAFIEVGSLDKDQRLYMQWLEDVKRYVDGK